MCAASRISIVLAGHCANNHVGVLKKDERPRQNAGSQVGTAARYKFALWPAHRSLDLRTCILRLSSDLQECVGAVATTVVREHLPLQN